MTKIITKSVILTIIILTIVMCVPVTVQGKSVPLTNAKCKTMPCYTATYTGKAVKPTVYVLRRDNGARLKKDKDYTVSYKDNVTVGHKKKAITIKFIGAYKGQKTLKPNLEIYARAPKINKTSYNKSTQKLTVRISKYKETSKTLFVLSYSYTNSNNRTTIVTKKKYITGNSYTTPKLKLNQSYSLSAYGIATVNGRNHQGKSKTIRFKIKLEDRKIIYY